MNTLRLFVLLLLGLAAVPGWAQVPDSTAADPADDPAAGAVVDSTAARRRPAARRPFLGFAWDTPGLAVTDTIPIRLPVIEASAILGDLPGTFVYDFGTPGWPDAWSPFGLAPRRVTLTLDGLPFDDLLTGRPRYDLLPLAYAEPPRTAPAHFHAPVAVHTYLRPFLAAEPLTELRYVQGGEGLKSIDAVHVQRRRLALFGTPGAVQLLGAYSGRAADGEYPGSRLEAARQLMGRIRYTRPGWSLELLDYYNRRAVGAHGGVVPDPFDFSSIYRRTGAAVRNPEARRKTIRNDLTLLLRTRLRPAWPTPALLSAFWTTETFRYTDRTDTLAAALDRYGLRAEQAVPLGGHRLHLRLDGWLDRLEDAGFTAGAATRGQLHLAARDSLRLFGSALTLQAGLHAYGGTLAPGGAVTLGRPLRGGRDGLRLFAAATLAGQPPAWVERVGLGRYLTVPGTLPVNRYVTLGSAGMAWRGGPLDALLFGFAGRTAHPLDLFATAATDTVQLRALDDALLQAGAAADLGWRRDAGRGFYATAQATLFRVLNPGASGEHARLAAALPDLFARGRLGARYLLFRGDLDLDVYLQGRFWTALRSRTLHPQSGLLALPLADAPTFGPAGTLDLVFEAGIRTAKFFLRYDNLLSGTALMAGTLLVPLYPLPQQRVRFGVYWPISG